jgi:3'-phosphoadenosine 5'-phosphosulfate sulfotransferase (PAPS reductase)/FAD synthetase
LEHLEQQTLETITHYAGRHEEIYVDISGGRYSTVLLDLASRATDNVTALYVDTTQSLPECTQFVKWLCEDLCVDLAILKRADTTMFQLIEQWGFPRRNLRWCMEEFKSRPIELFNTSRMGKLLHLVGVSMFESTIRMKIYATRGEYYFNRHIGSYVLNPLLRWKEQDILDYMKRNRLPENQSYMELGQAGNCFYCPFIVDRGYYMRLARLRPERFTEIVEAEEKMRNGGAAIYVPGGEKVHVSTLEAEEHLGHSPHDSTGCNRLDCACGSYG